MCTIVDNFLGTFSRALATEIGNTLFSDKDVHIVLSLVMVRYHWYDSTDLTFLGYRRTREDRDKGVTGKVTRATSKTTYQMDAYPTILHLIGCEDYYWKGFGVNLLDSVARNNRPISEQEAFILSDKLIRANWFESYTKEK